MVAGRGPVRLLQSFRSCFGPPTVASPLQSAPLCGSKTQCGESHKAGVSLEGSCWGDCSNLGSLESRDGLGLFGPLGESGDVSLSKFGQINGDVYCWGRGRM